MKCNRHEWDTDDKEWCWKCEELTLEENINFLKSQKKLIISSIDSLHKVLKEKEILSSYFNNSLRQKEMLIKSISRDLISDDRAFSEADVVKKLQHEKDIKDIKDTFKK